MSGNVLGLHVLPLHPSWQVLVLLPFFDHNPRVPAYLLEGLLLPMIVIEAPYDVIHVQEIKDDSVVPLV
jgi:hypothetical protein